MGSTERILKRNFHTQTGSLMAESEVLVCEYNICICTGWVSVPNDEVVQIICQNMGQSLFFLQ